MRVRSMVGCMVGVVLFSALSVSADASVVDIRCGWRR